MKVTELLLSFCSSSFLIYIVRKAHHVTGIPIDKKQFKVMKRYASSIEKYKSESQYLLVSISFAII